MIQGDDEFVRDFVPVNRVYQAAGVRVSNSIYFKCARGEAKKTLIESFSIISCICFLLQLQEFVSGGFEGLPQ